MSLGLNNFGSISLDWILDRRKIRWNLIKSVFCRLSNSYFSKATSLFFPSMPPSRTVFLSKMGFSVNFICCMFDQSFLPSWVPLKLSQCDSNSCFFYSTDTKNYYLFINHNGLFNLNTTFFSASAHLLIILDEIFPRNLEAPGKVCILQLSATWEKSVEIYFYFFLW